jgi:hypothetical protein
MFTAQRQLRMHDPDNDTLAMVQVLQAIKTKSEEWID